VTKSRYIHYLIPFTQHIQKTAKFGGNMPSHKWLHGRIEGQAYVVAAAQALAEYLRLKGAQALVPVADERFKVYPEPKNTATGRSVMRHT